MRAKVIMLLGLVAPALALAPACSPTGGGPGACEGAACDGGGGDAPLVPDTAVALDTGLGPDVLDTALGSGPRDAASGPDADVADADDAGSTDAGEWADGGDAASISDAGDAAACTPFKVNPETRGDLTGGMPLQLSLIHI